MECIQKKHIHRVENKNTIEYKKKTLSKQKNDVIAIHNEYCLKRNQFRTPPASPNLFCQRLEIRMKKYYNDLYSSFKL
jgi:hypothetical protein|tara:strand:- start:1699 stop:1932 length:234 start_codon:yes stop_codon:yes gene_type:complete